MPDYYPLLIYSLMSFQDSLIRNLEDDTSDLSPEVPRIVAGKLILVDRVWSTPIPLIQRHIGHQAALALITGPVIPLRTRQMTLVTIKPSSVIIIVLPTRMDHRYLRRRLGNKLGRGCLNSKGAVGCLSRLTEKYSLRCNATVTI